MRFPFRFRFRRQQTHYGVSQRRPGMIRRLLWRMVPRFRWPFARSGPGLYGSTSYGGDYGPTRYGENVPAAPQHGFIRRLVGWPLRLVRRVARSCTVLLQTLFRGILFPF
ncbi:MAG: hypothetical protein MK364_05850, partial [Pirellulales bacterium]|nr:hypothetical protein [Pirellulales bacterium]